MKNLVDIYCPQASEIHLVVDNLNTHNPAALYEVFQPEEARRIVQKLQFHYTPKHGSWLNQVEIEFSVLSRSVLVKANCLCKNINSRNRCMGKRSQFSKS